MKTYKGRMTLAEQKEFLGIHWKGHPDYKPTKAHKHPQGSYYMELVGRRAILQNRLGMY